MLKDPRKKSGLGSQVMENLQKRQKKKEVVVASGGDAIANAKAKREAQKAAAMSVDRSKKNMTPIEKFKEK